MLTHESNTSLFKRKDRGDVLIATAWSLIATTVPEEMCREDMEAAATDAISDILTAMFGPAGEWSERDENGVGIIRYHQDALTEAALLIQRGFDSYKGDAEDYFHE